MDFKGCSNKGFLLEERVNIWHCKEVVGGWELWRVLLCTCLKQHCQMHTLVAAADIPFVMMLRQPSSINSSKAYAGCSKRGHVPSTHLVQHLMRDILLQHSGKRYHLLLLLLLLQLNTCMCWLQGCPARQQRLHPLIREDDTQGVTIIDCCWCCNCWTCCCRNTTCLNTAACTIRGNCSCSSWCWPC